LFQLFYKLFFRFGDANIARFTFLPNYFSK